MPAESVDGVVVVVWWCRSRRVKSGGGVAVVVVRSAAVVVVAVWRWLKWYSGGSLAVWRLQCGGCGGAWSSCVVA